MPVLPTGTVTFLFTDIEGSTRLLHDLGDRYPDALETHRRLLRSAINDANGYEFETQGDGLFVAFADARSALTAAIAAQRALQAHHWPEDGTVRVRMGLHTGQPAVTASGYVGLDLHRTARICATGWGGQILVSQTTKDLVEDELPAEVSLRDIGQHRLKDLARPQRLFQVMVPDLPGDFPPLRSLDIRPHNLPVQLTSFIGRENEKAEVKRLLSSTRLLTLTGPGGAGKTRLALEVAADVLEHFPDGVWWVELAPLSDRGLVAQTVASALKVREQPGRPTLATLEDFLQSRHLLLILDNCEHLLVVCAELANTLLRSCPNLSIMTTSREGLSISGELSYRVPSLSVPDLQRLPPLEHLVQHEATQLFVERATFASPSFKVTNQNAQAIGQICTRLDGMPLAIELAAARVKTLAPEQIATRLVDRFRVLTGGDRLVPRHATLQATIDWSYDLLSEQERAVLLRLSAFAGGFTLEAAEAVCAGDGIDQAELLDLVSRLVDKSLVSVDQQDDGDVRYRMLETVRQYANDRLEESGEAEAVRTRHLRWFADLADQAQVEVIGPAQAAWFDRLETELGNFRAALEWSAAGQGSVEDGLRLAGSLHFFWQVRGHIGEGQTWLERLLAQGSDLQTGAVARALNAAANLPHLQGGDADTTDIYARQALALAEALGDIENQAWALYNLAIAAEFRREYDRAEELVHEGLALVEGLGDTKVRQELLNDLGWVLRARGDYNRAIQYYEEYRAVAARRGDLWSICASYICAATAMICLQDYARAVPLLTESLGLAKQLNERSFMSLALTGFAWILGRHGHPAVAATMLGAAHATLRERGLVPSPTDIAEVQREIDFMRDLLGGEAYTAAYAEGETIPLEQALETALEQIDSLHLSTEAPT